MCGGIVGVAIAALDIFAFEGETSPLVIVGLLFVAAFTSGTIWDRRGGFAAVCTWQCLPLAHLITHLLHLPDTLHPNTYQSILLLAAFTFAVSVAGVVLGVVIRRSIS
jgi:hypothetical protein